MDDAEPEVQAAQRRQARAVYRLAEADGCRHVRLVGHFGERIAPCGDACDRCAGDDLFARLPSAPRVRKGRRDGPVHAAFEGAEPARERAPAAPLGPGFSFAQATRERGDGEQARLFESLRAWRTRTAKARGVPAYVVFPDATLVEIAAARPASEEALLEVKGVGPRKLADYGAELLELIRAA